MDYCRGVDRGDEALVASVYHPDATDDHGRLKGTGFDFAAYAVPRLRDRYQGTMHSITNTVIDFGGPDLAHVESHVCARHWREDVVLAVMAALEQAFSTRPDYPARPPE